MFRRSAPRSRLAAVLIPASATLLLATAPLFGQGTRVTAAGSRVGAKETSLQRIQKMVARINAEAGTPEGEEAVLDRLSKQLGAPADSLRAQHSAWGLGYGEVAMAYGFARASRKPDVTPGQVVEMRKGGMAWDAIGKELGVRVDTVAGRMRKHVAPKSSPRPK